MFPLSNAETTVMPEMQSYAPATAPIRVPYPPRGVSYSMWDNCAYCGIRLAALPLDEFPPVQIEPDGPYYHPGGCVSSARMVATGIRADVEAMLG